MSEAKSTCPICGELTNPQNRPFCSTRCQEIDLNRWLSGHYIIPTDDQPSSVEPSNDNGSGD